MSNRRFPLDSQEISLTEKVPIPLSNQQPEFCDVTSHQGRLLLEASTAAQSSADSGNFP